MFLNNVLISLMATYFFDKHMMDLTVFNCWPPSDNFKLARRLNALPISANILQLNGKQSLAAFVALLKNNDNPRMGVFLQFNCEGMEEFISVMANEKCFSQKFHWLMYDGREPFGKSTTESALINQLNQTLLYIDAEITYADTRSIFQSIDRSRATRFEIPLYDVYNNGFHIGGQLNVTFDRLFTYDRNVAGHGKLGRSIIAANQKYNNRNDMRDVTLRVGTVYQVQTNRTLTSKEILEHYVSDMGADLDVLNKPSFQIATHIHELLKFNITWLHHKLWSTNDTYGGVLGDMLSERIDLCYAYFGLYDSRLKHMHPIVETHNLRSVFIFRTYGSQQPGLISNVFLKPFDATVWLCLTCGILVLASVFHLIIVVEDRRRNVSEIRKALSYYLTMINTLGVFCQQGATITPNSFHGRLLLMVVNLTSILVYCYYTTEVLSALISSPVSSDIRTLTQLAMSHLTIGFENTVYIRNWFNISTDRPTQLLRKRKIDPNVNQTNLWTSTAYGLNLVRFGGYAFLSDSAAAYMNIPKTFEQEELCDLNEIDLRPKIILAFYAAKQSPYKELFKTKFRKMRDSGILTRYSRIWSPGKPSCNRQSMVFSVGLEYTGALMVFLAASMVLSLVILMLEIAVSRKLLQRRRRIR